jgi:DNA polymerase-3 subunit delta'
MVDRSPKRRPAPPQDHDVHGGSGAAVSGFRDLIGQERAVRLIQQGLRIGRTAHAYLFTGADGVGRRTAALMLARALNCGQSAAADDGCGVCVPCRKIARGLHPDVQVIEPAGTTMKIDQVRMLEADAVLGPYEGKRKVFILDRAEKLTEQAANALLKTLEEPTGWTVFVLVTSSASTLPPTVVSRCQVVPFSTVGPDVLEAFLTRRGLDRERARLMVSFSRGSVGRALALDVASLTASRDALLEAVGRGLRDGPAALIDVAEKHAKDREGLHQELEVLLTWFRDLMLAKVTGRSDCWLVNRDRGEALARQAEGVSLPAILDGLRAVHATINSLSRNGNPRLCMEHLLLRLREAMPPGLVWVSG